MYTRNTRRNASWVVGWSIGALSSFVLSLATWALTARRAHSLTTVNRQRVADAPDPVMFARSGQNTLHVSGAINFLSIPFVWAFYPETANRTLEEMDYLFMRKSPFVRAGRGSELQEDEGGGEAEPRGRKDGAAGCGAATPSTPRTRARFRVFTIQSTLR